MANKDREMMGVCISEDVISLFDQYGKSFEFPLDKDIVNRIAEIYSSIKENDDDYEIYRHLDKASRLWRVLIEKSIKCLRYFDQREPFLANDQKSPQAYGVEALAKYYEEYTEFESILYSSDKYYRDHVVHVFRTWLSGVECLVSNSGSYLDNISIGSSDEKVSVNRFEKLCIWTLISLTHDLGYPLEKAQDIINSTRNMISTFIPNPKISLDMAFQGVQNYMNDFIVRLMSSKMIRREEGADKKIEANDQAVINPLVLDNLKAKPYVARLQPKYYFKFQKSLEKTQHGIISTLIIYKLLTYFLESDYNINEDYTFSDEDCRQFYIRREILRSIASHTCEDIYHLYMNSFAFLLIITDDTQEWGRKYLSELYVNTERQYRLNYINMSRRTNAGINICEISEDVTVPVKKHDNGQLADTNDIKDFLQRLKKQCIAYTRIFRDGQETAKRDFNFKKVCNIKCSNFIKMEVEFEISTQSQSKFSGEIEYTTNKKSVNEKFNEAFLTSAFDIPDSNWKITDGEDSDAGNWRKGTFEFLVR